MSFREVVTRCSGSLRGGKGSLRAGRGRWGRGCRPYAEGACSLGTGRLHVSIFTGCSCSAPAEAEELYQKRVLTITGICVALLVVGIVCVVAYCKTK